MATLSNVNITITATDQTASGVNSALSNVSRLGNGFSSVGNIASGVFGGILGSAVFSGITKGIGSVVSSAFGMNTRLAESEAASRSMVEAISESEPVAESAFGAASKAASAFAKTMREIREREGDGLADYAAKVDDIKTKIQDAQQEIKQSVSDRLAKEKQQLDDLKSQYADTYKNINENIADENRSFEERMYDMQNSKQDKLDNLSEQRVDKESDIADKIAQLNIDLIDATEQSEKDSILAKIVLRQKELADYIIANDAEKAKVIERANHEIAFAKQTHDIKIQRLQQELKDEEAEYTKRKLRIEEDAKQDVERSKKTSDEKISNLNDQLKKEEESHKRFLRDITEAYADAKSKMEESINGGGGTSKRTIQFAFDFGDSFRASAGGLTSSGIEEYLTKVNDLYTKIGVRSPFNIADIQNFGKAMVGYTGGSSDNMEKMINIAQSLAARNPMQGMLGATTSMVELFGSGNVTSLARRFDIPKDSLDGLSKAKDATEFIDLLGNALERSGINMGLVEAKTNTFGGAAENLRETFNLMAAQVTKPIWDSLTEKLVKVNQWFVDNDSTVNAWTASFGKILADVVLPMIDGFIKFGIELINFWNGPGQNIVQWFKDVWTVISVNVVPTIELLKTIWQTVQKVLEETIIPGMQRIYDKIAVFYKEIAPEVKKSLDFMKEWWTKNQNEIMDLVKVVWAIIEFVISAAVDTVKLVMKLGMAAMRGDWSAAWDAIKKYVSDVWDSIKQLGKGLWDGLDDHFKRGINGIIDKINGFISSINELGSKKIKIGDIEVGGWSLPHIPKLAAGGIVTSPTLAMIGEAGPEAVIPLSASKGRGGVGGGISIYVTGNEIMDEQSAGRLADIIGIRVADSLRLQGNYL